jgi:hypothetical protein
MAVVLGKQFVQATLDGERGEGLTIFLSQPPGSTARYTFRVRARTDQGLCEVGTFTSCPPRNGSALTRAIAMAACPGVREWTVDISPAPAVVGLVADPDESSMWLSAGCCAGIVGVERISERAKYYTGAAGVVTLLPGEEVVAFSTSASGAGATVIVSAPDNGPIPVPVGGGVQGTFGGLLKGPATLTFAGTDSYLVEVAESA